MKKIRLGVAIGIVGTFLFACTDPFIEGELSEINERVDSRSGVVEDSGSGAFSVSLTDEEEWEVGDRVRVYYRGPILESDPAQFDQQSIEKID